MPTTPAWRRMPTVPLRPCPTPTACSAYESESDSVQQPGLCMTVKILARRHLTNGPICLLCGVRRDFQNGGSHLGQRFSAIPHPIVPRFSPLEPQFIPTIQVFLRIWKFVPVCIWERKVCDDVANFGQILAYFWGSCPPGGRQPQNMGCVIN